MQQALRHLTCAGWPRSVFPFCHSPASVPHGAGSMPLADLWFLIWFVYVSSNEEVLSVLERLLYNPFLYTLSDLEPKKLFLNVFRKENLVLFFILINLKSFDSS